MLWSRATLTATSRKPKNRSVHPFDGNGNNQQPLFGFSKAGCRCDSNARSLPFSPERQNVVLHSLTHTDTHTLARWTGFMKAVLLLDTLHHRYLMAPKRCCRTSVRSVSWSMKSCSCSAEEFPAVIRSFSRSTCTVQKQMTQFSIRRSRRLAV